MVLNFQKYRDRDYTHKERQRRYLERHAKTSDAVVTPSRHRHVTQAEAEAEAEENNTLSRAKNPPACVDAEKAEAKKRAAEFASDLFRHYPRRENKPAALKAIAKAIKDPDLKRLSALPGPYSGMSPEEILKDATLRYAEWCGERNMVIDGRSTIPYAQKWFNQQRYLINPETGRTLIEEAENA